jgi:hypothetical protein
VGDDDTGEGTMRCAYSRYLKHGPRVKTRVRTKTSPTQKTQSLAGLGLACVGQEC